MPNTAKTIYTINQSHVTAWLDDKFVRSLLINLSGHYCPKKANGPGPPLPEMYTRHICKPLGDVANS